MCVTILEGERVSLKSGVYLNGITEVGRLGNVFWFTDPITKSTFIATTEDEAVEKLDKLRKGVYDVRGYVS